MSSPKPVAENGFERAELSLRFRRLTELQDLNSAHCPFCGELAEVRESYHCASGKPAALPAFVGCRGCGYQEPAQCSDQSRHRRACRFDGLVGGEARSAE